MRPGHSNLSTLFPPATYLRWCATSPEGREFQALWRRPMWETVDGLARPLHTNIHPGDRVMHGEGHWQAFTPQISIIVNKTLVLGRCAGRENRFEYRIDWNIGGHYGNKTHEELTDGYWIWIPWFEQLVALGFDVERAARLVLGQEEGPLR